MSDGKSSISNAKSYAEMGEFWDTHDLTDFWDQTEPVAFEVDLQSDTTYYAVDKKLSAELNRAARQRGVSAQTLLNLWLQEDLQKHRPVAV
jgi:hypothetical protein